jgi:hypothetical protein
VMEEAEDVASPSAPSSHVRQYMDAGLCCLVRLYEDGLVVQAKMESGPHGFALAFFANEEAIITEMPNLLLAPAPGAKAPEKKKGVLKRPCAVSKASAASPAVPESPPVHETDAAPTPVLSPAESLAPKQRYIKMYYKKTGRMAIRQKLAPKRQIFQFACAGKDYDELVKITDTVIYEIEEHGMSVSEAALLAKNLAKQ